MPRVVHNPTDSITPSVKCHIHPENVYELFCEAHDDVFCVACKLVEHSKCGVENVQARAKDQDAGQLKRKCLASMGTLWGNLDKLKNGMDSDISREEGALSVALDEIEIFKKTEIAKIERLAQQSVAQVKKKDEQIRQEILEDMKSVEDKQKEIDGFQINVSDNITDNNCDLFVYEKLAARTKTCVDDFVGCMKMGDIDFVSVNVPPSEIAPFPEVRNTPYQLDCMKTIDIVGAGCKSGCDLRDMCILDSGHVLLTDFDNKCLHRLDCLYKMYDGKCKVIERCSVDGEPFGVCALSPDKVAVTLCVQKKVCLIFVGSRMQVTKEFPVGEQCRGISFKDGFLYVACWAKKDVPQAGEIKVFDLNGQVCRKFSHQFNFISHLCVSSDGKYMYASDLTDGKNAGHGFTIINIQTGMQRKVTHATELASTFSIGNGNFDEILAGDRDNKVIYRIDSHGQIIQKLENKILVSSPPQSVLYYRKHIIMSTRKSGKLFVFFVSDCVGSTVE